MHSCTRTHAHVTHTTHITHTTHTTHTCHTHHTHHTHTTHTTHTQELEDHHSSEVHQLLEQVQVAEGTLSEERRAHMATQTELSRVSQELEESREETRRERASQAMLLKVETYIQQVEAVCSPCLSLLFCSGEGN